MNYEHVAEQVLMAVIPGATLDKLRVTIVMVSLSNHGYPLTIRGYDHLNMIIEEGRNEI